MINRERLHKLQTLAQAEDIAAFVVAPSASLFYLTEFSMGLSERPAFLLVPKQGEVSFLCPAFEAERVRRGTGIERLITYTDEAGPYDALSQALTDWNLGRRIAFEFQACRLLEYDVVAKALGNNIDIVDARPHLAQLRMAKDATEQAHLERAAAAVNVMLDAIQENLKPGVREVELEAAAREALVQHYPDAQVAFISIASGERTAIPHAGTTDRALQAGDLVWADLGARVNGYVSDITRTFATGPLDAELAQAYELVLQANIAACRAARPGVLAEQLDEVAREVIRAGGFGPQFTHRTGHGIGLEVHEEPYIVAGNALPLRPGYAFTIEPGIYLPGKGGIRIEDNVIITETGAKVITSYPRDLRL
ncbi:MAG: aminopeptidase P family protein [Firmicutes bacterium]|nr:aminopeptidase P family protein [Bacillota bacterium]